MQETWLHWCAEAGARGDRQQVEEGREKIAGFNADLEKVPMAERSALQDKLREAKGERERLKDLRFEQTCKPIVGRQGIHVAGCTARTLEQKQDDREAGYVLIPA